MIYSRYQNIADLSGATVSILCAIHCAITPLIFLSKPIIDSAAHVHGHSSLWGSLDWVFLVLSLGAVWYSAKHTGYSKIGLLLWIFWAIFAIGLLFEMGGIHEGEWLMYLGSFSLAITHGLNMRYSKNYRNKNCC